MGVRLPSSATFPLMCPDCLLPKRRWTSYKKELNAYPGELSDEGSNATAFVEQSPRPYPPVTLPRSPGHSTISLPFGRAQPSTIPQAKTPVDSSCAIRRMPEHT